MILTKIWTALIAAALMSLGRRSFALSVKALSFCGSHAAVNSIGNLMLLIALLNVIPSVQYPLVTGGTMFFALIISFIRREKITKRNLLGTALAIISTVIIIL